MRLTRELMLERMAASDATYDRRFIVGVHSTGIYCLPSCKAKLPKPENVVFYDSPKKAQRAGLRACKRCRPDDFLAGIDRELERLEAVVREVRGKPASFKSVDEIAVRAAMSPSHLFASLRSHFGVTPGTMLANSRVAQAQKLLKETALPVGEVGLETGYETMSAFYENFGRRVGMPPAAYRKLQSATRFAIELPADLPLDHLRRYLARDSQGLTERVTETGFEIGMWAAGVPCAVSIEIEGTQACVGIVFAEESPDMFAVHGQVSRLLGLTSEPKPFEDHLKSLGLERLVEGREGTRIPQSPTPFDGLVWSILGQQINLTFASTLRRRLIELAGRPLANGMYAPPTAETVAPLNFSDLMERQFSFRKAEYLVGAAQAVVQGSLNLEELAEGPVAKMEKALLAIKGIGPWSANYLMMRALGAPDCLPLGDTGLTSALAKFFDVPRPGPTETVTLMEPFRPYRSLATYHLWQSLHVEP